MVSNQPQICVSVISRFGLRAKEEGGGRPLEEEEVFEQVEEGRENSPGCVHGLRVKQGRLWESGGETDSNSVWEEEKGLKRVVLLVAQLFSLFWIFLPYPSGTALYTVSHLLLFCAPSPSWK